LANPAIIILTVLSRWPEILCRRQSLATSRSALRDLLARSLEARTVEAGTQFRH